MKLEHYKNKIKDLKKKLTDDMRSLAIQFASENNPYKIGDVILDDSGVLIKIEKIITYLDYSFPCCVYEGIKLKKDLTPMKSKEKASIYQERVKLKCPITN